MKIAAFIPIKENSERVKGKNFRVLGGKKLYEYVVEKALKSSCFDVIYIDTDSNEIKEKYEGHEIIKVIDRKPELALNTANGNDLLAYHLDTYPRYDFYFQLFATSPFIEVDTIKACVESLVMSSKFDSVFTAIKRNGFFWLGKNPVNYRPDVLPRSQDLEPIIEETTALYGISHNSLKRFRCRIGEYPNIYFVNHREAVDINIEEDLEMAKILLTKEN